MSLIRLLEDKHAGDTFVPECLLGASGSRRMDAWVMLHTWSPATTIGYEIKVSRSDFVRDDKWADYLPVCNLFYFVAPAGLIQPSEVPEGTGLMLASANGTRLYTKVKAPRREVDAERVSRVMRHVLMNRAQIVAPYFGGQRSLSDDREQRLDRWRKWLETNRAAKSLGYEVRSHVAQVARDTDKKNQFLRAKLVRWGKFAARLRAHGIDPDTNEWSANRKIDELAGKIDPQIVEGLRVAARHLHHAAELAEQIRGVRNG